MTLYCERPVYPGVMEKLTEHDWRYNGQRLMSYGAMLNLLYGGRGVGKTFFFKVWCLLVAKGETVWMRRYENEINDARDKFCEDLISGGFITEDMDIEIEGNTILLNGEPRIHFVALSISMKKKSVPYPNVNWIVFDEFIETRVNRNYLPNEAEMLLEFISTVNRYRPDRQEVRTFLIGNKVSWFNEYTAYFHIEPFEGQYKTFKDGLICVENYANRDFEDKMKQTRFGRLISGTKYEKYAIENQSLRDTADFIKKRPKQSWLKVCIRVGPDTFGIWTDGEKLYFSTDFDPNKRTYADREDLHEKEIALKSGEPPITWLLDFHRLGMLCFDTGGCKTVALNLMMTYFR